MKILILHNRYQFAGGEDSSVQMETRLLKDRRNEVAEYILDNTMFKNATPAQLWKTGWDSSWSSSMYERVRRLCRRFKPEVAHVHNFWPRLTPSVFSACRSEGVPVVQSLHNFRLICLNGTFFRNGKVCTLCKGRTPWPGVALRCYRGSLPASAAVARMILDNRRRNTWRRDVDVWIALSEHSRSEFIDAGLPRDRIIVKPNFCSEPENSGISPAQPPAVLYAGRLSPEKGVFVLLQAWENMVQRNPGMLAELRFVGDGPARSEIELASRSLRSVRLVGWKSGSDLLREIQHASIVVVPSVVPETFGRTVVEAWSCRRPVIASRIGALPELIQDNVTGILVEPGLVDALARGLEALLSDPSFGQQMGMAGYDLWKRRFSPEANYDQLLRTYCMARERFSSASR